ncbi:MAG: hypothetical protein AMJ56_21420 [Anaerolineae bacterium SG8_19]|jgi:hypothetical protein|nr:MAG: hypothetical protein AMJ56_21420 [Anaerolineae bacterium SG8_19]HCB48489.1 hypothetical protein [Chloroflexota bacterium]
MRSKELLQRVLALAVLVVTLFALAACQKAEQIDEAASTLEAELQMTAQPEPSATAPEAPAEEPTEVPTEEAMSDVEPTPTEAPAIATTDMEEYVSTTEFFSLKVPAGWSSEETLPGAAFVVANSEEALARYQDDSTVEPGDFVMNVGFIPYRLLQTNELRNLNFAYDAPPDVFLQSLLPMFRTMGEAVMSDIELVSLSEETEAGRLTVSDAGREGMVLMFAAGDSVIALVSTVGFPGEMDEYQDMAYAVASEVAFSGEQDALYGTLLGG